MPWLVSADAALSGTVGFPPSAVKSGRTAGTSHVAAFSAKWSRRIPELTGAANRASAMSRLQLDDMIYLVVASAIAFGVIVAMVYLR
jgi:hypothetical protein